jgi:streptomycin 6-kinase
MADPVVVHADLHHENILRRGDGWVAIDAKGVIAEPAYETGALLRNPRPWLLDAPDPGRVLRRRADQLADALELDVARVRGWAYAQAVLSAAWHVEDGEDPSFSLTVAELLEPLTR